LTVTPGSADLKLEMAACWKVSWNVDPLPFSVPLREPLDDELLDERHGRSAYKPWCPNIVCGVRT
jgi:hypothetical protein